MKKYTIAIVSTIMLGWLSSCNDGTKNNEDRTTNTETSTSTSIPSSTPAPAPQPKRDTFVCAGTEFYTDGVINAFYKDGLSEGSTARSSGWVRHDLGCGTETRFKSDWIRNYGVPDNQKAKEVYNQALEKYIKGYNEGYNF